MTKVTDLEWRFGQLPNPGSVHPESRIIVWQWENDLPKTVVLKPNLSPYHFVYEWVALDGTMFASTRYMIKSMIDDYNWAWLKSFHKTSPFKIGY